MIYTDTKNKNKINFAIKESKSFFNFNIVIKQIISSELGMQSGVVLTMGLLI